MTTFIGKIRKAIHTEGIASDWYELYAEAKILEREGT